MAALEEDVRAERELFRDSVRRFIDNEIRPHYEDWEEAEAFPREVWTQLGEAGLLCLDVPEAYGGAGADFALSAVVLEELGRAGMGGLATAVSVHSDVVTPYLLDLGSDAQKEHWLPRMVAGEAVIGIGMTEPGAGSDLQGMRTRADRDGDGWVLNGAKTFITNGIYADVMVIAARTRPEGGARGTSLFLVDTSLPGFRRGRNLRKLGQHAGDTAELFFEDLRLPDDAILGREHQGFIHLIDELPRERLALAVAAVAAAEGMIEWTADYVRERKAFGQPLSSFQNTRFRLAEMRTDAAVTRAFVDQCMDRFRAGTLDVTTAAMAKLSSTEMQWRVADGCLQLFGGYGYMREYPIARAFADARVQRIYGGTSEIMKELIARDMLGKA
ncbi:acyl-CoA dehydrogenase [Salinisphaera sp. PC39]|uniref:acyl-CoA dehydrogenase family protein n=1 Tax=Salinisphaera sp. PC39 TaxID=1304156 RepID=UPI00334170EB